ncbi:MAG: DUF4139 domain-containing protein [Akkermansiaceae bacterium]|nr:DUF4139 domain-containing protein [Akkermansiaceae bacterium]
MQVLLDCADMPFPNMTHLLLGYYIHGVRPRTPPLVSLSLLLMNPDADGSAPHRIPPTARVRAVGGPSSARALPHAPSCIGALEDIRLTRDMPTRSEGETGIITTTNEREELAVLEVENLGDETWPVRMIDQVPYSEQDDLQITVTATPKPSETDVDGQRGILAWEFDLAGGEKKEVKLKHVISWPDGMILQ